MNNNILKIQTIFFSFPKKKTFLNIGIKNGASYQTTLRVFILKTKRFSVYAGCFNTFLVGIFHSCWVRKLARLLYIFLLKLKYTHFYSYILLNRHIYLFFARIYIRRANSLVWALLLSLRKSYPERVWLSWKTTVATTKNTIRYNKYRKKKSTFIFQNNTFEKLVTNWKKMSAK